MSDETNIDRGQVAGQRPRFVRRASVRLSQKDWRDLIHFISTDTQNMEDGCEIKRQMERICDAIRKANNPPNESSADTAGDGTKTNG